MEDTVLRPADLVAPLFVIDGKGKAESIPSMPAIRRLPIADLVKECRALRKLGVLAVALFPKIDPRFKDAEGAAAPAGRTPSSFGRSGRSRIAVPDLTVMTDIALDPYTAHGHDGVLTQDGRDVDNDRTVGILAEMAVLHAAAGVDLVAPSDMMDGRVGAIRRALDAAGREGTAIMAYTAKYASAYYGPFRQAVGSARPSRGPIDKRTYQLNPANRRGSFHRTQTRRGRRRRHHHGEAGRPRLS